MTQASSTSYLSNPFILGAFRATLMFPLGHFADMIKVAAQKSPSLSSLQVIKDIYKGRELRGFAHGAKPNFPRRVLKDTVRWPVISYSYHLLTKDYPDIFLEQIAKSSVFSAIAFAAFDFFVLRSLELLMAYRSSVWSMWMGFDDEIKNKSNLSDRSKLSQYTTEVISFLVTSTVLVATLLPLGFIKTNMQMNSALQGKKIAFFFQTLIKRLGFFLDSMWTCLSKSCSKSNCCF